MYFDITRKILDDERKRDSECFVFTDGSRTTRLSAVTVSVYCACGLQRNNDDTRVSSAISFGAATTGFRL